MHKSLLTAMLILAAPTMAHAETARQRDTAEARLYLTKCPTASKDEADLCRFNQKEFVADYVNAKAGDYDDQRNVAFMLHHGADGAVRVDVVQSCAWYLYNTHSGNPRTGSSEVIVTGEVCNLIPDEAGHLVAATRAARIQADIRESRSRPR